MSGVVNVRAALEIALNAMTPAIATAFENSAFTPPSSSTPYQKAFVLFADPDNSEFSQSHTEQGIFQITLQYPLQSGTKDAATRAELIRTTFARGASFTNGGIVTKIQRTPTIGQGSVDGDRWSVPVKCRFSAFIP